jgi:hypothetical protein
MMCSHGVPFERHCLFCFRAATEAEKLRRQKEWLSPPHVTASSQPSQEGHVLSSSSRDACHLHVYCLGGEQPPRMIVLDEVSNP